MIQSFFKHTKKQVLVIEDSLSDFVLIELSIRNSPIIECQLHHRKSLADGIAALQSGQEFEAILLDLSLGDSTGLSSLETIMKKFPDSNVIVMTGNEDPNNIIKSLELGAQDYFNKNTLDKSDLAKTIRYSIEQKNTLKRLEETQRLAQIGSWTCIPSEAIFSATDEVYRIFELNPKFSKFSYLDILSSVNPFYILSKIHEEVITKKINLSKDMIIKDVKGNKRYIYIQCTIRTEQNQPYLYGIIQDITDRKLAEEEISKTTERYQDIFTKSKDVIYIANLDGSMVDFNDATTELLGYPRDILAQVDIHSFFKPNNSKELFLNTLRQLKSVKDFSIEIEGFDNQKKYCVISANLLDNPNNNDSITYSAILRDETIRKQAESFKKARDFAQQTAKMREQFVATISHEMRTPMNAIIGMTNLLIDTELDDEQLNYVNSVKNSSEVLLGIVNDILDVSSIKNGKVEFQQNAFDLHELMINLINVMQGKIKEKDLYLQMSIYDGLPKKIMGDKLRLNQILYNLVGNAIKFTEKGSISIGVLPSDRSAIDDSLILKFFIEDTGIGIPKDKIATIFDSFTRVQYQDKNYEGTGLGLSIVKGLVENQEGKIWIESTIDKGSTFFFELPFKAVPDTSVFEANQIPSSSSNIATATKKDSNSNNTKEKKEIKPILDTFNYINILLVEDHKLNQVVAKKTLEKMWPGIKIDIADNGKIAIDKLEENPIYDIVLMDIQMPVMDGHEAIAYIRKELIDTCSNLPIIAMTAHAFIANEKEFKNYGFDEYILKPFEPNDMYEKIKKLIQHKISQHNDNQPIPIY